MITLSTETMNKSWITKGINTHVRPEEWIKPSGNIEAWGVAPVIGGDPEF